MVTAGRKIDVKSGLQTMTVQDITIEFQMFEAFKKSLGAYDCFSIDVVDYLVKKTFIEISIDDPLEICITQHGMKFENEENIVVEATLNAAAIYPPRWQSKFETLPPQTKIVLSIIEPPKLELNLLPDTF
ncbi:hypothetical protein FF1_032071 [Malus domestica]